MKETVHWDMSNKPWSFYMHIFYLILLIKCPSSGSSLVSFTSDKIHVLENLIMNVIGKRIYHPLKECALFLWVSEKFYFSLEGDGGENYLILPSWWLLIYGSQIDMSVGNLWWTCLWLRTWEDPGCWFFFGWPFF